MSLTRLFVAVLRARGHLRLVAAITVVGALVVAPAPVQALTVDVTFPDPVMVGQSGLTAHVTLTNTNAMQLQAEVCNPGACAKQTSEGIIVTASCGLAATPAPTCGLPDPGVFVVDPTAPVPVGSCGQTPVTSFDVSVVDPALGKLLLMPVGAPNVILGLAETPTASCDIPLTFSVSRLPASDADTATLGQQTLQLASAQAIVQGPDGEVAEDGSGRDTTTVNPRATAPPPPITPPPPPITPPAPPITAPESPIAPAPPQPLPPTAPNGLDHFKCYEALQPALRGRGVLARDQFGLWRTRVVRTRQVCNPVSKNGGRVINPRAHLVCYETRDLSQGFRPRTVLVTNQFGQRRLTALRPSRLCVPSLKRRGSGSPTGANPERVLDHFRCYDVRAQPAARTVRLSDQFGVTQTKLIRVVRLCNPVRKNNSPVRRAKAHLVCYSIRDTRTIRPPTVRVRNQFGRAQIYVRRPETLCLPSFKEVVNADRTVSADPA